MTARDAAGGSALPVAEGAGPPRPADGRRDGRLSTNRGEVDDRVRLRVPASGGVPADAPIPGSAPVN